MKILVLTGSPHKDGTSALLADKFVEGALEKGHQVARFDTAFKKVGGCLGCGFCWDHNGVCVQKDDMTEVYGPLLEAELVVFVTPLYFWDMTAQLKCVVDRFYAFNRELTNPARSAVLLATCNSMQPWAMDALTAHYKAILRHLHWEDRGVLLAQGMGVRADIENSEFPQRAKELGLGL